MYRNQNVSFREVLSVNKLVKLLNVSLYDCTHIQKISTVLSKTS
jgi:hypothetical protein